MDAASILFVVDAGPTAGGGHVMRCLTLAQALAERGQRVAFVAPPAVADILEVFADCEVARVAASSCDPADLAAADVSGYGALVFDHYCLDGELQARMAAGRPALVIDDLANRRLYADLVLDAGPARRPEDYQGLVNADTELLLGPDWALVRPQFVAHRAASLARRGRHQPVANVQVALGLSDLGGVTARVVHRLAPRIGEAQVDIVLGADAPSRAALEALAERDPRVRVHVGVRDMAALTAAADLAIGAAGSSSWERCVLGVPTVLLVLAENQAPAAQALAQAGAVEEVDARASDFEAAFDRAVTSLLRSPERRARQSQIAAQVCDGEGAGRAAGALLTRLRRRRPNG